MKPPIDFTILVAHLTPWAVIRIDIFGFEVFKDNSFEQLCINYCNERLQTFFNEIIFEGEMRMYVADGVNCDDISFQDNMECVKLIDLKGAGIFSVLGNSLI